MKPTKTILSSLILLSALGCANSAKQADKPEGDSISVEKKSDNKVVVEFNGNCANAVAKGKFDVPGDVKYSLQHDGKTYYFGSEAAMKKFSKHIAQNVTKAQERWSSRDTPRR